MTVSSEVRTEFRGFTPAALHFFEQLAQHQERAWFEAHRQQYQDEVRAPLAALVEALAPELRRLRLPLLADAQRALFRIHRDVRFSHDKRPYKTHAGAALSRSGEKMDPGMLYVHIDPLGCFMASGFYRPPPDALRRLRSALVARPDALRRSLAALARAGYALEPDQDALQRVPRGFEGIESEDLRTLLRWKSFIVRRPIGDEELYSAELPRVIAQFLGDTAPWLRFGWDSLDA